jgi:hypothetical protein
MQQLVDFITASDIAQALGVPANSLSTVVLYIQSSNPANERVVLYDMSNTLHPAAPIRIELDPLGWATIGVIEIKSLGEQGKIASPGLVDKYLALQGIVETQLDGKGGNWTYTVVSKCSGIIGLWTTPAVSVKKVEVNFVSENGDLGGSQNPGLETTDLGKAKWFTLKLKGRSKVIFHLIE